MRLWRTILFRDHAVAPTGKRRALLLTSFTTHATHRLPDACRWAGSLRDAHMNAILISAMQTGRAIIATLVGIAFFFFIVGVFGLPLPSLRSCCLSRWRC